MSRNIHFEPPRKWKRDRLIKETKKLQKFEADRAYPITREPEQKSPSPPSESVERFSNV